MKDGGEQLGVLGVEGHQQLTDLLRLRGNWISEEYNKGLLEKQGLALDHLRSLFCLFFRQWFDV